MNTIPDTSDERLLDLLRSRGALGIVEMAKLTSVTSTAVRQRLTRLMDRGLVEREATPRGRGRPSHRYSLTEKGRRQAGSNFPDLAIVLWKELRAVKDPDVRQGLFRRIAESMAEMYRDKMSGDTATEKIESLVALFDERKVQLELSADGQLPVLTVKDCPYPELAEQDRSICAVEKMLFSRLLEQDMRLSQCRLEGFGCCQFVPSAAASSV
jgi:DeoR family transcriptional regulator, suf operon transcriptional repressor